MNKMIYGAILAGGIGSRMGYANMPKQFLSIRSKPIIIHTIEKFILNTDINEIFIGVPKEWVSHMKDLIEKYIPQDDQITVVIGGSVRNETIMNIIDEIEQKHGVFEDDLIITHDAVRPFVSQRIIKENILAADHYGACDTVVPVTDTIVFSEDNEFLSEIPDRSKIYKGQTPQSFKINLLKDSYNKTAAQDKEILTDACKICVLNGIKVKNVLGEESNFKITTPYDLKLANTIIEGEFLA